MKDLRIYKVTINEEYVDYDTHDSMVVTATTPIHAIVVANEKWVYPSEKRWRDDDKKYHRESIPKDFNWIKADIWTVREVTPVNDSVILASFNAG